MSTLTRFTFGNNAVINFDVTANWAANGVTDVASFITFMNAKQYQPNLVISYFSLVGNRLQLEFTGQGSLDLSFLGVTDYQRGKAGFSDRGANFLNLNFNGLTTFDPIEPCPDYMLSLSISFNPISYVNTDKISYTVRYINAGATNLMTSFVLPRSLPNLIELELGGNRLSSLGITAVQPVLNFLGLGNGNTFTTFEYSHLFPKLERLILTSNPISYFSPVIPLPNTINSIQFNGCRFTTQGYEDSESWANSLTVRPNRGQIDLNDNLDSAIGTNFKTILESKGFTVLAN